MLSLSLRSQPTGELHMGLCNDGLELIVVQKSPLCDVVLAIDYISVVEIAGGKLLPGELCRHESEN